MSFSLFAELRRRNVIRMAGLYLVGEVKLLQARADNGEQVGYLLAQLYVLSGDNAAAAKALTRAVAQRDPNITGDELYALPEDRPDDHAIRAALDRPSIKPLFEMRRGFIESQELRIGHD